MFILSVTICTLRLIYVYYKVYMGVILILLQLYEFILIIFS